MSNGRARKRNVDDVSAPTGQIWMTFPLKILSYGSSSKIATCSRALRSNSSMNGSPAIWSLNRVQRAHNTQRSRSSFTSGLIGTGFVNRRFGSMYLELPGPYARA